MRCLVVLCAFLALALDLATACNPATWTPREKAMYRCFRRNRWTNPQLRAWYDRVLNPATRPACAQLYVFSEASACMSVQDFAFYGVYECTTTPPPTTTPYVPPTTPNTTPPTTPYTTPQTTPYTTPSTTPATITPTTPSLFPLPPGPPAGGLGGGGGAGGFGGLPPPGNQFSGVDLPPGPG